MGRKMRLEADELSWLCEQLALVQKSGISVSEGIDLLADSTDRPQQAELLKLLSQELQSMVPLSEAMEKVGGFPHYLIQMTRIGETSGNLDHIMENLSDFYHKDADLKRRFRSALIYPLVLLCMMAAVILLLMVRVLPIFNDILTSFGAQMPPFSNVLLQIGLFFGEQGLWFFPLLAAIIIVLVLILRIGPGRYWLDRVKPQLPLLGSLYRRIYAARFALALSYLLRSSIDMDTSLGLTETMLDNALVQERIAKCREEMRNGKDAFAALQDTDLFPKLFVRMLALGNRTGDLETVMGKVARSYESDVNNQLSRLTSLVEPFLVIILSIIVGGILLTVMLPLIEIMSSIG